MTRRTERLAWMAATNELTIPVGAIVSIGEKLATQLLLRIVEEGVGGLRPHLTETVSRELRHKKQVSSKRRVCHVISMESKRLAANPNSS